MAELSLLAKATCYLAFGAPYKLKVGAIETAEFIDLGTDLLAYGLNLTLYKNLATYCFQMRLADHSRPPKIIGLRAQLEKQVLQEPIPYGDSELEGFVEWWEALYGIDYLANHPGSGPNGHDDVTEQILEKAKIEFKAGVVRWEWEMKRAANMQLWRQCVRQNQDVARMQSEEDHTVLEIRNAKMVCCCNCCVLL